MEALPYSARVDTNLFNSGPQGKDGASIGAKAAKVQNKEKFIYNLQLKRN